MFDPRPFGSEHPVINAVGREELLASDMVGERLPHRGLEKYLSGISLRRTVGDLYMRLKGRGNHETDGEGMTLCPEYIF